MNVQKNENFYAFCLNFHGLTRDVTENVKLSNNNIAQTFIQRANQTHIYLDFYHFKYYRVNTDCVWTQSSINVIFFLNIFSVNVKLFNGIMSW